MAQSLPAPAFELRDGAGRSHRLPSTAAVVAFVKEDCPTCNEVMPVLIALHRAFGARVPFLVVGQNEAGNRLLESRYAASFGILDDSELQVSFDWDVETVPTVVSLAADGSRERTVGGFVRGAWRDLLESLGAWNDAWCPPMSGPVDYLASQGLVNERLVAVHCVQLGDADLRVLAAAGATVVACPRSNRWTGAGTPPRPR